jgi:hypothetical protein
LNPGAQRETTAQCPPILKEAEPVKNGRHMLRRFRVCRASGHCKRRPRSALASRADLRRQPCSDGRCLSMHRSQFV